MAITSSIKGTAFLLQVALLALYVGVPAGAQSNVSERPTTSIDRVSPILPTEYQRWLDEDVRWIITPQERAALIRLSTNEARDGFVEQFWQRRDPTPGTAENEYKKEHYRRIYYTNVHFAQAVPGWEADRGRFYILYGPPDRIKTEAAPSGGDSAKPTVLWHYNSIPGYGKDIDLKFVDVCSCGDYRLETPLKDQ
jgi:GWxTD domain-containing protein